MLGGRDRATRSDAFTVRLTFSDDLRFFLKKAASDTVVRQLKERTSVKDLIEACGVPHTEVDRILVSGKAVDFLHVLNGNAVISVHSVNLTEGDLTSPRLQARNILKFVLDGHLGKLARNLRLLGFDVFYGNVAQDRQLLGITQSENRALITRDRRLLMHSIVQHGYCPRSQDSEEQTIEVVRRFDLPTAIAPFTRCLICNALLETIEKKDVVDQLEPLTKIYYETFRHCAGCGKIYWGGSHFDKLRARVERIRATLEAISA
jgi:uncharacterized protein with PIN domain